jgi:uncharacterized protein YdeI (YjbR/CyaY-like superfamily)
MAHRDPRVDAYITGAAPFAQSILERLRHDLHAALPGVDETIKWGMPFFVDEGRIVAHMAAFKQHCAFGFWRGRNVANTGREGEAMGQFGRIASVADLPSPREFKSLVKAAAAQARERAQAAPAVARRPAAPAPAPIGTELRAALQGHAAARRGFESLTPGRQREYVEWIAEAKREATRTRRIAQALEWLVDGKSRNWKYEAC